MFCHHEHKCGRQAVCVNCGMPEHCPSGEWQRPAKCANCSGNHPANNSLSSAVKPSTCNKQTQTENRETQTDDSFTEYLKQQTPSEKNK